MVIGQVIDQLENYLPKGKKIVVITDANVYKCYSILIDRFEKIIIEPGEQHKTLDTMGYIYSQLIALGADRETFILGFGGGIVTDITGFAASTYMRGVRFGFVATTLLAQVDASVGGKNGVNCDGYKNMVGTFNQPEFVLCDLSVLKTLPEREFRAGLSEIFKSGLIRDAGLFELFEQHTFDDFYQDENLLRQAITRAVKVKKAIVDADEKEHGQRKLLNLGHTLAHAIEKSTRRFEHGEAVAIGLVMIAGLSVKMGLLPAGVRDRIVRVVENMGLPADSGIPMETLFEALKSDKKKDADSVSLILLREVADCEIRKMNFEELKQ
ncbi:MAG: 3-dehydroquinate synthase [Rikenellaceae bacterium]|nr:3-dehydroquinate synthase [Rikenellaceae bacterium]